MYFSNSGVADIIITQTNYMITRGDIMSFRIAAATSDGINIDLHFGHADTLYIYEVHDDGSYKLYDKIHVPEQPQGCENGCRGRCHGGGGGFSIDISFLKGVKYVLAAKIGNGIEKSLLRNNITAFSVETTINNAVRKITIYEKRLNGGK